MFTGSSLNISGQERGSDDVSGESDDEVDDVPWRSPSEMIALVLQFLVHFVVFCILGIAYSFESFLLFARYHECYQFSSFRMFGPLHFPVSHVFEYLATIVYICMPQ